MSYSNAKLTLINNVLQRVCIVTILLLSFSNLRYILLFMNIIVAVNNNWGIGYKGEQTIVIPEDREYFREITDGGIVIIGRKTFESMGKPLPNRKNIVLTNNKDYTAHGVTVVHSIGQALEKIPINGSHKVFVIGGAEIYAQFLPWCYYAYVTKLDVETPSDRFFPNLDESPAWEIMHMGDLLKSNDVQYSFDLYRSNIMG